MRQCARRANGRQTKGAIRNRKSAKTTRRKCRNGTSIDPVAVAPEQVTVDAKRRVAAKKIKNGGRVRADANRQKSPSSATATQRAANAKVAVRAGDTCLITANQHVGCQAARVVPEKTSAKGHVRAPKPEIHTELEQACAD